MFIVRLIFVLLLVVADAQREVCDRVSVSEGDLPYCFATKQFIASGLNASSGENLQFNSLYSIQATSQSQENAAIEISHNLYAKSVVFSNLLTTTGYVLIYDNPQLQSIGFPACKEYIGSLLVTANDLPEDIGLEITSGSGRSSSGNKSSNAPLTFDAAKLETVSGKLTFLQTSSIDLSSLIKLDGDLHVQETSALTIRVPKLQSTSGSGTISMRDVAITSLDFSVLQSVAGSLSIVSVEGFVDIPAAFPALEKIFGSLVIQTDVALSNYNSSIIDISGSMNVSASGSGNSEWTCDRIRQQYKDSGIVKGSFSCDLSASTSGDNDNSASSLYLSPIVTAIAFMLII